MIGSQAGLPALTIPVGFTRDGLPVGLELLGAPLAEAKNPPVRALLGESGGAETRARHLS